MAYWLITIVGYLFAVVFAFSAANGLWTALTTQTQEGRGVWLGSSFVLAIMSMIMAAITYGLGNYVS